VKHFGIISPPVSGHINPFSSLGRELISRGHKVTVFHFLDLEEKIKKEGLGFCPIGQTDHPLHSFSDSLAVLGNLQGIGALRFTISAVSKTTRMFLRDAPLVIKNSNIDALLVDQMEPAGCAIAELLGLPFITICNALILNEEAEIPPPFSPWHYSKNYFAKIRNEMGYYVSKKLTGSISSIVNETRLKWNLKAHSQPADSFSKIAQISQQVSAFDFPRKNLPSCFHYVGPLRDESGQKTSFPWEKLDGRPLIYASLGTLQNRKLNIFKIFAEACEHLDAQLVITHGGGLSIAECKTFAGNPLVVNYAPQVELLKRASLTLTHSGLNTVMDSLAAGVPLVAIPITYEQPAIANRLKWQGAGEVLKLSRLNKENLKAAVARVLVEDRFRRRAKEIQTEIKSAGGVSRAADIIEKTLYF
jgi:zeaxanthin glucosyltransferase